MVVRSRVLGLLSAVSFLAGCAASDSELPVLPDAGNGAAGGGGVDVAGSGGAPLAGTGVPAAGTGGVVVGGAGAPLAGSGAPVDGTGYAGMGGTGGTGGTGGSAGAAPVGGGSGGGAGTGDGSECPSSYTVATHIVMNVRWDSSLALAAGTGQVHIWSKSSFAESGTSATVMTASCGSTLPVVTTSAIAGGSKVLPEIPDAAWDSPMMPTFMSTATRQGSAFSTSDAVALVGLTMSDPIGSWPAATAIMAVDHDGDGKPGVTANSKEGNGFQAPPTSIAQTKRADKLYLATRNIMTLSAQVDGCPETYSGTANVTKFDSHVIGCHIKDSNPSADCSSTEWKFVDDNRTVFKVNNASFQSMRVADTATCADVRTALPPQ